QLIARAGLRGLLAALVRALPAALPLALAAAHLFDGGMAATLPGAAWGHIWVPALGTMMLALTLRLGDILARRARSRALLAAALALACAVIERGNRTFLPSEYPDIHAFLVLASVVTAGAAIHLSAGQILGRARRSLLVRRACALAVLALAASVVL